MYDFEEPIGPGPEKHAKINYKTCSETQAPPDYAHPLDIPKYLRSFKRILNVARVMAVECLISFICNCCHCQPPKYKSYVYSPSLPPSLPSFSSKRYIPIFINQIIGSLSHYIPAVSFRRTTPNPPSSRSSSTHQLFA